jgi:hypothetical protein
MGTKWTATLKVDFEMDEGVSAHLAEARLKVSAAEFQRQHKGMSRDAQFALVSSIGAKMGVHKMAKTTEQAMSRPTVVIVCMTWLPFESWER